MGRGGELVGEGVQIYQTKAFLCHPKVPKRDAMLRIGGDRITGSQYGHDRKLQTAVILSRVTSRAVVIVSSSCRKRFHNDVKYSVTRRTFVVQCDRRHFKTRVIICGKMNTAAVGTSDSRTQRRTRHAQLDSHLLFTRPQSRDLGRFEVEAKTVTSQ